MSNAPKAFTAPSRETDLINIDLHSRKLTFHYDRDFEKTPLPRLPTGASATVAISGLKTFSNGFSDGFITFLSAQINRASGNVELQYNRSASSEEW